MIGEVDLRREISVTVYLRASVSLDWVDQEAGRAPAERRTLSRSELATGYGARDEDVAAVRAFAGQYGLDVAEVDGGRRAVQLRGTVEAMAQAFGAQELELLEHPTAGPYRGRQGPLTIPRGLDGVIIGAFGIDERPQARPYIRPQAPAADATSYTPLQVAAAYSFPDRSDRRGGDGGVHRARWRVQPERSEHLLLRPRADRAERDRGRRRWRHELARARIRTRMAR